MLAVRRIQMNAWLTRLFGDRDSRSVVRVATREQLHGTMREQPEHNSEVAEARM